MAIILIGIQIITGTVATTTIIIPIMPRTIDST